MNAAVEPAEAVFIEYVLERDQGGLGFVRNPVERPLWHLPGEGRMSTRCGLDMGYSYPRCSWVEVPPDAVCPLCEDGFSP